MANHPSRRLASLRVVPGRDVARLLALVALIGSYLSAVGLRQLWTVRASTYDLVIYDQGIRAYSRFDPPVAISMGVRSGLGPDFTLLGDHFSPVLALLAPLYWIYDSPATLVVAQGLLLATGAIPLWLITRRHLGTVAAYLVAVGYGLSWPLAKAAGFDFHEVAFAPLLTGLLLERFLAWRAGSARTWHVVTAGVALACVKEDMGLLLAGFGLAVVVIGLRQWRTGRGERTGRGVTTLGVGFVLGGLGWTAVATAVVIPAMGGRLGADWRYTQFGATPREALVTMLGDPLAVAGELVTPQIKVLTLVLLGLLTLGSSAVSPWVLMVVPLLAARLLATQPAWWSPDYHYNAFLVVPLLVAGVDGIDRVARWLAGERARRVTITWSALIAVVAVIALPRLGDLTWLTPDGWRRDAHAVAGLQAAARIPDGVLVEAPNSLGPQLTSRTRVLLLDYTQRDTPWVIVDTAVRQFPFCTLDDQRERAAALQRQGYQVMAVSDDYVVLHDPTAEADLAAPAAPSPCR